MNLIPRPATLVGRPGSFAVTPSIAGWLREPFAATPAGLHWRIDAALAPEGYVLDVGAGGIDIRGGSPAGLQHAVRTLRQLLPAASLRRAPITGGPLLVPFVHVEDAPRFAWRGVLLDVARHFMPIADVLRFLDLAAFHKLNVLHLHLTDDQGWRVAVPGRPRLTTVGAWRPRTMLGSRQHDRYDDRPHGGHYTTEDLREIVAYAAERHVTVLPEIDMPGHMQAAIAAYPELGNGFAGGVRTSWGISPHVLNVTDEALDFCREVLDHVCAIFPGELIGIGGDECPSAEWVTPAARARIKAEGLAGPPGSPPGWPSTWRATAAASTAGTRSSRAARRRAPPSPRGGARSPRCWRPGPATTSSRARTPRSTWTTASPTTPASRPRSAPCSPSPTCTPSTRSRPA
jgi:hexosaminidase